MGAYENMGMVKTALCRSFGATQARKETHEQYQEAGPSLAQHPGPLD